MHELLLFGHVLEAQTSQVTKVLAGISEIQPQSVLERHLIYKPRRKPGQRPTPVGGTQGVQSQQSQALLSQLNGELFYMQLVSDVKETDFATKSITEEPASASSCFDAASHAWKWQFRDLPEVAGRRPATSRMMAEVPFTAGNPPELIDAMGYSYVSEYLLEGSQFIYKNLILLLYRLRRLPREEQQPQAPRTQLPPWDSLSLFDPSGGYILQASVRVQDGSKPEGMTLGVNELRNFKDLMRGVVELEVGDRLSLDARSR
ncbi:MAG: Mediator of RNA polymerase II transcription subunit 18 [Cirrosporium novae-zelandiae]|nr:MAG: Mediator of RNA polymerase II transcription subunit 18 [Cirrosporium novae-zelandiae]